jgi:hypothetical protein
MPDQRAATIARQRSRRENATPEQRAAGNAMCREQRLARESPDQRASREWRERQRQERARVVEESTLLMQIKMMLAVHCNIDSLRLFDTVHSYFNVGPCSFCCDFCGSLGFDGENRSRTANERHYGILCCNKGKIMLDGIPPFPPLLGHLFTSNDPLAKTFRKRIHRFNSGMTMASFQASDETVTNGAPGCFKVVGQVYRRIGSLLANDELDAKCLQVYFLDPDYQAEFRDTRYLSDARAAPDEQDVQIFSIADDID